MNSSRAAARRALALVALALGASVSGCELIVRFDESKLMDVPAVDAPRADSASEAAADAEQDAGDATMAEASTDAAVDAADVQSDGFVSRPDSAPDATPDAIADSTPDSAAEPSPEPTVEAGVEPTPEAGVDASDDAAPMGDAAMDASTD